MNEIIKVLIAGGIGGGLVVAWIVIFGKSLITHFLKKDLEEYKGKIASDNAKSLEILKQKLSEELQKNIEKYKSTLQIKAALIEKKQSEAHTNQRDALVSLRTKLQLTIRSIETLKQPSGGPCGASQTATEMTENFITELENVRGDVSKETIEILDLAHAAITSWASSNITIRLGKNASDTKWWDTPYEKIDDALEHLEEITRDL